MNFTLIIRTVTSTTEVQLSKEYGNRPVKPLRETGYYSILLKKLKSFSTVTTLILVGIMFNKVVDIILDCVFMILVLIMSILGTLIAGF